MKKKRENETKRKKKRKKKSGIQIKGKKEESPEAKISKVFIFMRVCLFVLKFQFLLP